MTDFADLLKQHGAPLPNATEMETEIRSEGALAFQTLNIPSWAADLKSSSVLGEWRCTLEHENLDRLQEFLKTVQPSGKLVQQLINEAFIKMDLGFYLGTFIESGLYIDGVGTVRMLFAYRSKTFNRMEEFNKATYDLLADPDPNLQEASVAFRTLREFWRKGTNKEDRGLMMLSEFNRYDPGQFPFTRAKLPARPPTP